MFDKEWETPEMTWHLGYVSKDATRAIAVGARICIIIFC